MDGTNGNVIWINTHRIFKLPLHSLKQCNYNCYVPDQLMEGAAAEDGTLEEEAFVAELGEVDLVAHRLLQHYRDAQHHLPDPLGPTALHPVVPRETYSTINLYLSLQDVSSSRILHK
jgi:hypothetical protein